MSGIAGIWGRSDEESVRQMMRLLSHRGPDVQGLCQRQDGTLGHLGLSIMDLDGGNRAMPNDQPGRAIIADGRIYDLPSSEESPSHSQRLEARSDAKFALHLYDELGKGMVHRLDGVFALAIADGEDIFLARDAIGIKPLYYANGGKAFVFASELKAFEGLSDDAKEFPPGTWFHSKIGFRPFYTVPEAPPRDMPLGFRLMLLRKTLERAVVKRLMSDRALGVFLSGGLDSSIIAAIVRRHVDTLHTFSVGIEGSRDLEAARVVARHLHTVHHEYVFTADEVREELPQIIYHLESFDQDLVRSAIPCFFASRLAADHVRVVLTGEGADELFAGYTYQQDIEDPNALHQELRRSVTGLHNIGLQRGDRLTMAWSLEGRVPFLDVEMVEFALTIPTELKLYRQDDGRRIEKWILRRAYEDLLPPETVWRTKEQFDEGSGTTDLIAEICKSGMSPSEAHEYAQRYPEDGLRSPEECMYHQVLLDVFSNAEPIRRNIARWSDRPFD